MKIYNQTKGKLIANNAKKPSNFLAEAAGLIGVKKAYSLILKTRFGIHTFGVRFPIDVLILDDSGKVVGIKENLKPLRFFIWDPKYDTVVEMPAGTIRKTKTSAGDKLKIDA